MSYTTLRVLEEGVVLYDLHAQRLGPAVAEAFRRFARTATPGVYSLDAIGDELRVTPRAESRLLDGMPARFAVSPVAGERGPIVKRGSPNRYDAVRLAGVATLLTSEDGTEIYESCVASVVSWDGERIVLSPRDRPRIGSVAEAALRSGMPFVEAPMLRHSRMPLALVNAVKGPCIPAIDDRDTFPAEAAERIRKALASGTRR